MITVTYFIALQTLQVNKAQNPQRALNPSRSKDAKGMPFTIAYYRFLSCLIL